MVDNESEIIGFLFGTVGYKSESHFRNLINELTPEQSLFFINKCIEFSYSKGIFTLAESELISKSLYLLNSEFNNKDNIL